eukprot:2066506-Rhodomonas_salina.2
MSENEKSISNSLQYCGERTSPPVLSCQPPPHFLASQGSASAVGALVAGLLMDFCGTKVARMVSAGVVLIGALFLASASENEYMWSAPLPCSLCAVEAACRPCNAAAAGMM